MKRNKQSPICKNGKEMIWGKTTFEYEEEDINIEVSNIPAWICLKCKDVSFIPGTTQQLTTTIRELIIATKRAREKDTPLYEYHVRVA